MNFEQIVHNFYFQTCTSKTLSMAISKMVRGAVSKFVEQGSH